MTPSPTLRAPNTTPLGPTPVPPAALAAWTAELKALVDELASLTGCGDAWSMRVLRRNLELALMNPDTLQSAENQLDFIEELAEAAWDGAAHAWGCSAVEALTAQQRVRREERRQVLVDRLGEIAHLVCGAAEAWWEVKEAAAEFGRQGGRNPQEDHSS